MEAIKDNNYIMIPGWMRTRLNLKGSDLLITALIYGFCQDEQSWFVGTLGYIADWIGLDKRNVRERLKKLTDRGVIIKREEELMPNIKKCYYKINPSFSGDETSLGAGMKHPGGGDETSPNNTIYNTIYNNIEDISETSLQPPPKKNKKNGNSEIQSSKDAQELIEWIEKNASTVAKMTEPLSAQQIDKLLCDGKTICELKDILLCMHNWKPLRMKNRSAYLTLRKWSIKDEQKQYKNTDRGRLDCPVYGDGTEF